MKKLFVVGIGPGDEKYFTAMARSAIAQSQIVFGYKVYGELVRKVFPQKEIVTNSMGGEIERCVKAFKSAEHGITTAIVCSGDAGIYGMASPVLMLAESFPQVEIEIVAGITAALSGSAVLGAPLTHDFAVISLSDLLTPWNLIEKRLRLCAEGDFCITIYNPKSNGRPHYLKKACEILLEYKSPKTICGWDCKYFLLF